MVKILAKILLTSSRTGRCGEWANAFTMICNGLGYKARLVYDHTDHVWTEVEFTHDSKAYHYHVDPCENSFNIPLLYERGWGKKLTYIFSISIERIVDSSKRYTQNWEEMKTRRLEVSE